MNPGCLLLARISAPTISNDFDLILLQVSVPKSMKNLKLEIDMYTINVAIRIGPQIMEVNNTKNKTKLITQAKIPNIRSCPDQVFGNDCRALVTASATEARSLVYGSRDEPCIFIPLKVTPSAIFKAKLFIISASKKFTPKYSGQNYGKTLSAMMIWSQAVSPIFYIQVLTKVMLCTCYHNSIRIRDIREVAFHFHLPPRVCKRDVMFLKQNIGISSRAKPIAYKLAMENFEDFGNFGSNYNRKILASRVDEQNLLPQRRKRLEMAVSERMQGLRIILDGVGDPRNRAAVFLPVV